MSIRRLASFVLILVLTGTGNVFAQNHSTVVFRAEPSRTTSGQRDQLEVTYTLVDVPQLQSLNLIPNADFMILPGQMDRQSSTTDITPQGPVRSTTIARTYTMIPRRTGKLTLPAAVARSGDGRTYRSNAPVVNIIPGSAPSPRSQAQGNGGFVDPFGPDPLAGLPLGKVPFGQLPPGFDPFGQSEPQRGMGQSHLPTKGELAKRLFVEIRPAKQEAWVGEPITVRYRLVGSVNATGSLTKLPTPDGFWVQDLTPANKVVEDTAIRGQFYQALLLKTAAFIPQRPGSLTIDPAEMEASTEIVSANGIPETIQLHLKSAPVQLRVKALPAEGRPASFTGAVGQFTVSSALGQNRIGQDGAAVLTLSITGSGNLTQLEIPKLLLPKGLNAEEPQVQDFLDRNSGTLEGRRLIRYTVTAEESGQYTMPPIEFSYFNPASGKYVTTRTAAQSLEVVDSLDEAGTGADGSIRPRTLRTISIVIGSLLLAIALWMVFRKRKEVKVPLSKASPVLSVPTAEPAIETAAPVEIEKPVAPTTLRGAISQLRRELEHRAGIEYASISEAALRQRLQSLGYTEELAASIPALLRHAEAVLYGGLTTEEEPLFNQTLAAIDALRSPGSLS